jgi:hypothetical protein
MEPLLEEHERVTRKAMPVAAFAGVLGIIGIIWIIAWSVT